MTMPVHSLYVHIPFCERKCEYCDFVSVGGTAGEADYVEALRAEIEHIGTALGGPRLDTIFFGGGTPGLIEPQRLGSLLTTIRNTFTIAPDAEITLEANPSSTSRQRAETWRSAGFNRVSIGVQSLEPDILRFLGRVHDEHQALEAVSSVREAGFDAVSCDLIYAVPGLEDERWQRTLAQVIAANPDHISCYELTVEPGTPLHASVRRGVISTVDAEVALRQHWIAVDRLAEANLRQYEVSNFAKDGQECRHNLAYWRHQFYAAAGVGAHGYLPGAAGHAVGHPAEPDQGIRYWHSRKLHGYVGDAGRGWGIEGHEVVDEQMKTLETVMLGLRLRQGVVVPPTMRREAERLAEAGFLVASGDSFRTTRVGEGVLNEVIARVTSAPPEADPAGSARAPAVRSQGADVVHA